MWISFGKGKGWKNQPFAEFTSSQWLLARLANATFSHSGASHNFLHYKALDKKKVVNAEWNVPRLIPLRKCPLQTKSPTQFHCTATGAETCAGEGARHRGTGLPRSGADFGWDENSSPRATLSVSQVSALPGPQRMSNGHWPCIFFMLNPQLGNLNTWCILPQQ